MGDGVFLRISEFERWRGAKFLRWEDDGGVESREWRRTRG